MKMPNFRLYDTQATTAMLAGALGFLCLMGLSVIVFKGLDTQQWVIPFSDRIGWSQYRQPLIYAFTPVVLLLGIAAGVLGFRSLGQSRNTKQGRSWMGMTLGAVCIALAPVMIYAWMQLSEPIIVSDKKPGGAVEQAIGQP
jgi:hypothetical protein